MKSSLSDCMQLLLTRRDRLVINQVIVLTSKTTFQGWRWHQRWMVLLKAVMHLLMHMIQWYHPLWGRPSRHYTCPTRSVRPVLCNKGPLLFCAVALQFFYQMDEYRCSINVLISRYSSYAGPNLRTAVSLAWKCSTTLCFNGLRSLRRMCWPWRHFYMSGWEIFCKGISPWKNGEIFTSYRDLYDLVRQIRLRGWHQPEFS